MTDPIPPRRRPHRLSRRRRWPSVAWDWLTAMPWYGHVLLCALIAYPAYKLGELCLELAWVGIVMLLGLVMGAFVAACLFLNSWMG